VTSPKLARFGRLPPLKGVLGAKDRTAGGPPCEGVEACDERRSRGLKGVEPVPACDRGRLSEIRAVFASGRAFAFTRRAWELESHWPFQRSS